MNFFRTETSWVNLICVVLILTVSAAHAKGQDSIEDLLEAAMQSSDSDERDDESEESIDGATLHSASPPLWKITDKGKSAVYLIAGLHFLPTTDEWQTPVINKALVAADTVWFEAETGTPEANAAVERALLENGDNPEGTTLSSLLGPSNELLLPVIAHKIDAPVAALETMRPWRAHMTIGMLMTQQAGFDPSKGAARTLLEESQERGQKIAYLETPADQLSMLTDMPLKTEVSLLRASLRTFDQQKADLPALLGAWQQGDTSTIDRILNEPMRGQAPLAYDHLVVDQNQKWASKIEVLLEGSDSAAMVISARHLVGPDSIPAMLEEEGYTVERQ